MSESWCGRVYARAPDRLGDVVMALPALRRLAERCGAVEVDVWCPIRWAPILEMAELPAAVVPFRPQRAVWKSAAWLRRSRYDAAYLFADSLSAAAVVWLARVPVRRGLPRSGGRWLQTERASRSATRGEHRAALFMAVADPEWRAGRPPGPRISVPRRAREQFERLLAGRAGRPLVGIVPGSRAAARRWPEGRFTALAGLLAAEGAGVVVFGGPGDEVLAARVAAGAGERGIDLGGRTSLAVFAAGLSACDLVVANDSGAIHLAAAVGAPVVGVFGPRAPEQTAPLKGSRRVLWHSSLPCAPCGKDNCPRRGSGTFLPDGRGECLQLVSVEAVARAVREQLREVGASSDV